MRCEKNESKRIRKIFSLDEISRIWQDEGKIRGFFLILFYTELRKGELLIIDKEKIDIEGGFFRTGIKTEAGKNRIIPIRSQIKPIFEKSLGNNFFLTGLKACIHQALGVLL